MKNFFQNLIVAFALAIFVFFFQNQPSVSSTLKFVQMSDVHYSTTRGSTSYKLLAVSKELLLDAINQINKIPGVDFVMITGDAIDQPNVDSARDVFSKFNTLKYPWYMAVGNHDTTTSGTLTKTRLLSLLQEYNSSFDFDNLYYSFKPKEGFKVIVLDGAKNKGVSSNGNIPKEQLDWLDNELKTSNDDAVLVFLHFPLYEPFPSVHHKILNSDEFYSVLDKYKKPIALFTGHYHTTKITKEGHLLHVSTPSMVSYPNSFRLVKITNSKNKIIYEFTFYETTLKTAQEKAKLMTFGSSSYYGKDEDRNVTIIMDK